MMTGLSPLEHGLLNNGETSTAMGNTGTLPARLREVGYQTLAVGKMHFGPQRVRHGFDEMLLPDDYYREMSRSGSPLQPMRHGLGQNELHPGMSTVPESQTLTSWIAERCVDFIRDRRDPSAPFFLWCSFSKPHPPLDPPEPYYSMYRADAIPKPVVGSWRDDPDRCPAVFRYNQQRLGFDLFPDEIWREARAAYYGLVTQIDYAMGRVLAALTDRGLLDDALIVATSDHGEFLGDQRAAKKGFPHEPAARVPFILRLPKSWPDRHADERNAALVTHSDLMPTLIAAAGGSPPDGLDGRDLIAMVRDPGMPRRRWIVGGCVAAYHNPAQPDYLALTDATTKYIWYPEGGTEQLFDLEHDPNELIDLATDPATAEQRAELHRILAEEVGRARPDLVTGAQLIRVPATDHPAVEARNRGWPGFITEWSPIDVRH